MNVNSKIIISYFHGNALQNKNDSDEIRTRGISTLTGERRRRFSPGMGELRVFGGAKSCVAKKTTVTRFELARSETNGFQVRPINHSGTLSKHVETKHAI